MEINELIKLMQKKQKAYNIAREEYILAKERESDETKLTTLKAQLDIKEKEYTKLAKEYADLRDKKWANKAEEQDKEEEVAEEKTKKEQSSQMPKKDNILKIEDKSMYQQAIPKESFWDEHKKDIEESPNFKKAVEELKKKIEKKQETSNIPEEKEETQETTQQEPNKALPVRSFWEIYNSTCTRSCGKYSKFHK